MSVTYGNSITAREYNELRRLTDWFQYSDRQMQIGIDNSEYIIVAKDGEQVIGAARLVSDGACYGIIADVIVRPEYRGAGIGKGMVNRIIEYVKNTINEGETYGLNLMAAKGRETFYEQLGFIRRNDENGHGMAIRVKG